MTVKELREMLAEMPEDTEVKVLTPTQYWRHYATVMKAEDTEYDEEKKEIVILPCNF